MTPTHEEVEALALMAEKSAYIAGVHDLPKLQQEWASVYTTLRALDTERQQLRAQRNLADAAVDAAGEMIADLRAQLAGAKNEGIVAACDEGRMIEKGAGGMTIDAQLRRSVYIGIPVWPIEEARAALAAREG